MLRKSVLRSYDNIIFAISWKKIAYSIETLFNHKYTTTTTYYNVIKSIKKLGYFKVQIFCADPLRYEMIYIGYNLLKPLL